MWLSRCFSQFSVDSKALRSGCVHNTISIGQGKHKRSRYVKKVDRRDIKGEKGRQKSHNRVKGRHQYYAPRWYLGRTHEVSVIMERLPCSSLVVWWGFVVWATLARGSKRKALQVACNLASYSVVASSGSFVRTLVQERKPSRRRRM